jgi:hypothetical protein
MRWEAILLQTMILVHTVDERPLAINMEQVQSIAHPGNQVTEKSMCLISFGGGRFVNTKETCREVGILWQREDAKTK